MLPMDVKHRWMFVAILLYGIFVEKSSCDNPIDCRSVLFVEIETVSPSSSVVVQNSKSQICCGVLKENKVEADCCGKEPFNSAIIATKDGYSLILNYDTLSNQDIVLMNATDLKSNCSTSKQNNKDFLLHIDKCLGIVLIKKDTCEMNQPYDEEACKGVSQNEYNCSIHFDGTCKCISCKLPGKAPETTITVAHDDDMGLEEAANIIKDLSYLVAKMGNSSTAAITIGDVKGIITKFPDTDISNFEFGFAKSGQIHILEDDGLSVADFSRLVKVPAEAAVLAMKSNTTFFSVLVFPGMSPEKKNSFFLNDEVMGIEMGTEISNLTNTVDFHYNKVDKNGSVPSCRSWDGKGKGAIWISNGCWTKEINDSIICHCSHLTFFAILMSPPTTNISSSDFNSLTYITSIGCGLSIFFLMVGLFMHCLIRKGKASQATKILMNLFVTVLILNLSFLVNEKIADLENFGACVTVAAVMHYSMLATFTWFFMQALHLYFLLWKLPTNVKHYIAKMCVMGWGTPGVMVIALLASGQYDFITINTNDGNSARMCWIPDVVVHQGVNIGYYAVVFVFTFVMFIVTLRQMFLLKPVEGKAQGKGSMKINSFSILGLFLLLGITWAFAFFSYGPLLIPSYYIFTILNSFQGFFLVIYYLNSRKMIEDVGSTTDSSRNTATTNTVLTPADR